MSGRLLLAAAIDCLFVKQHHLATINQQGNGWHSFKPSANVNGIYQHKIQFVSNQLIPALYKSNVSQANISDNNSVTNYLAMISRKTYNKIIIFPKIEFVQSSKFNAEEQTSGKSTILELN